MSNKMVQISAYADDVVIVISTNMTALEETLQNLQVVVDGSKSRSLQRK